MGTIITDADAIRGNDDHCNWSWMGCGSIVSRDGDGVARFDLKYLPVFAEFIADQDRYVIEDYTYEDKYRGMRTIKQVFCQGEDLEALEQKMREVHDADYRAEHNCKDGCPNTTCPSGDNFEGHNCSCYYLSAQDRYNMWEDEMNAEIEVQEAIEYEVNKDWYELVEQDEEQARLLQECVEMGSVDEELFYKYEL